MHENPIDQIIERQDWLHPIETSIQSTTKQVVKKSGNTGRAVKDFLNGTWLNHPLHAALTDAPVGSWTAATILDLMSKITGSKSQQRGADAAIAFGIVSAIPTALAGLADWSDTGGAVRRVGLIHALANSTALTLFSISMFRRMSRNRKGASLFSTLGFSAAFLGAYLGGELAYRWGTQVNRNAWLEPPTEFTPVLNESDLAENQPIKVEVKGQPIVLIRKGTSIFALCETCSHMGGPLSQGALQNDEITCPWHGSTYNIEDGSLIHGPSAYPQPCYDVRVRAGKIEVRGAEES